MQVQALDLQHHRKLPTLEQKLKSLESSKDWSNYLLVTTVAALGWMAKDATIKVDQIKWLCILFFGISIVFAILTLALIPHIGQAVTDEHKSFYDAYWNGWFKCRLKLRDFCLIQHVTFLLGILFYAGGTAFGERRQSVIAIVVPTIAIVGYLLYLVFPKSRQRKKN